MGQFNRELGEVRPSEAIVRRGTELRKPNDSADPPGRLQPGQRGHRDSLQAHFPDFRRAYAHDGLSIDEFDGYGATTRTLRGFIASDHDLVANDSRHRPTPTGAR